MILEIKNLWPEVKLVRGSARHSDSNGGVERVNQTVEKKLGAWMKDNSSKRWSVGCKLIQWRINTSLIELPESENAALEVEVEEVAAGNALEEEDPDYGLKPRWLGQKWLLWANKQHPGKFAINK